MLGTSAPDRSIQLVGVPPIVRALAITCKRKASSPTPGQSRVFVFHAAGFPSRLTWGGGYRGRQASVSVIVLMLIVVLVLVVVLDASSDKTFT